MNGVCTARANEMKSATGSRERDLSRLTQTDIERHGCAWRDLPSRHRCFSHYNILDVLTGFRRAVILASRLIFRLPA
jgi:hypothetical protein